jgi:ABC-type multidrug transport system fused ATPase/permease subunit
MKGRTTFIIAHRLSTIGYAQRIIVIGDGRIIEDGMHEQLLARRGKYFKFYQKQFADSPPQDLQPNVAGTESDGEMAIDY